MLVQELELDYRHQENPHEQDGQEARSNSLQLYGHFQGCQAACDIWTHQG